MRGSHQPLNDMLAHDPLAAVFGDLRGEISSADHGRQTDLIGAVHLFPSPGAAAAPHPVGWEGQQPRLPEMKPTAGGKDKRKLEASSDPFTLPDVQIPAQKRHAGTRHAGGALQPLGGGSGASGAAATKDRPLLRREQKSIDCARGTVAVSPSLQPGHGGVVETTTCHFCRRADLWSWVPCGNTAEMSTPTPPPPPMRLACARRSCMRPLPPSVTHA